MRHLRAQRTADAICASVGLVALSPVLAAIALRVLLKDGRPVIFRQTRVGKHDAPFVMYKFRTMSGGTGPNHGLTVGEDPRVTPAGKALRRLKLDELPQLVNVVRGDMALVGPRPELPEYVRNYTEVERAVLRIKPGITDPASLKFRHESDLLARVPDADLHYVTVLMPEKIRINLEYAEKANMFSDLSLVLRTIVSMFDRGRSMADDDLFPRN